MKYVPRRVRTNVNVSRTHPLKEFALLAGGLLAAGIITYLVLGLAVDLVVPRLSTDLELQLGGRIVRSFTAQEKHVPRTDRVRVAEELVERVQNQCSQLPYPVQLHVIKGDAVNAAALPGGHLLLFEGLLQRVQTWNELGFVIGHELGHMVHRDHLRGLGRALVLMAASTVVFGADSGISDLFVGSLQLTEMKFSRSQEVAADEYGLEVVQCFFGHAGGATDFFRRLPPEADPGWLGHYFASHPEHRFRVEHLKKVADERGYREAETISLEEKFPNPSGH